MTTDSKMTREIVLETLGDPTPCSREHAREVYGAVSDLYDTTETLRAEVERLRGELDARKEETKADILNIFKLRSELEAAKREVDRQTVGNVIGNAELQSLYDQLEAAKRDAERSAAALKLIWRIHVRDNVHLGLERESGIRSDCIPCICGTALGVSMDGQADTSLYIERLAAIDAAIAKEHQR